MQSNAYQKFEIANWEEEYHMCTKTVLTLKNVESNMAMENYQPSTFFSTN